MFSHETCLGLRPWCIRDTAVLTRPESDTEPSAKEQLGRLQRRIKSNTSAHYNILKTQTPATTLHDKPLTWTGQPVVGIPLSSPPPPPFRQLNRFIFPSHLWVSLPALTVPPCLLISFPCLSLPYRKVSWCKENYIAWIQKAHHHAGWTSQALSRVFLWTRCTAHLNHWN